MYQKGVGVSFYEDPCDLDVDGSDDWNPPVTIG